MTSSTVPEDLSAVDHSRHSAEQSASTSPKANAHSSLHEEKASSLEGAPGLSRSSSMVSGVTLRRSSSSPDFLRYGSMSHHSSNFKLSQHSQSSSGSSSINASKAPHVTSSSSRSARTSDPQTITTSTTTIHRPSTTDATAQSLLPESTARELASHMSPSGKYSRLRHHIPPPEGMCRRYSTEYFPRGDGLFTDIDDASVAMPIHKAALDTLFTYMIGMVVALWWRSSWYLMDKLLVVDGTGDPVTLTNILLSLFVGLGVMTACIEARGFLIRRANAAARPCSQLTERLFTLAMGLAAVAQWRSAWYLGDLYFSDDDGVVTNTVIMNVASTLALIAVFSLKSVVTGVFLDGSGFNFYTFYEAWKVGNENIERVKRTCWRATQLLLNCINRDSASSANTQSCEQGSPPNDEQRGAGSEALVPDMAATRSKKHVNGSDVELQTVS